MGPSLAAGVAAILDRDLRALRRELEAYPDERQIWQEVPGLPNTAGTLALHLAGNLQHYIGARWGGTGYVRNRDAEFARRGVSRAELLSEVEHARAAVAAALPGVSAEALGQDFPEAIADRHIRTDEYLVHLCAHFASSTATGASSPASPTAWAPSRRSSWGARERFAPEPAAQQLVIGPVDVQQIAAGASSQGQDPCSPEPQSGALWQQP
jgi:hypothetical protein